MATNKDADAETPEPLSRLVTFGTAGLGGVMGWMIVHPSNVLAVRMNLNVMKQGVTPGMAPKLPPFYKFAADIVKNEGVGSLYNGLSAGITRQIFYATSRYGLFEVFRDQMAKYRETDIWSRLLTGCASGGAAAFISCPAEVSLVRMANDNALPKEQRRNYKSVLDAAIRIGRDEGVAAYWRGSMPFVNRAMLVGATQVGTYDQFRSMYEGVGLTRGTLSNTFASSLTAGLLYSTITMPFETAKNRMAFQKPGPDGVLPYRKTLQTISTIAKAEGVLSLWSGFIPYFGRCGGHTVSMFIFVEQLRKIYRERFM